MCSRILPVLGVVIVFLLVAGMLLGLGMMMGLFGGKNYIAAGENKDGNVEANNLKAQPIEKGYLTNEPEDGKAGSFGGNLVAPT